MRSTSVPGVSWRWCVAGFAVLALVVAPAPLPAGFDANGWIVDWLYFGPLSSGVGDSPGIDGIRADWLADGASIHESTVLPQEGDELVPDFAVSARSIGWHPILLTTPVNWIAVNTTTIPGNANPNSMDIQWIHSADGVTAATVDNAVVHGVVYVNNPGPALDCFLHLGSDDSCQVKVDDCEAFISNLGRGWGDPLTAQDSVPVRIEPGAHRVLFKVFNGGGGFGFRLRFADAPGIEGRPITDATTPALQVSLDPADFGLSEIEPFGVGVSRAIDPEKVIGTDEPPTVTLTATKTYAPLSDATVVTIAEDVGENISVEDAVPAFTSKTGTVYTWELPISDLVAGGITYRARLARARVTTIAGTYAPAGAAACGAVAISGETDIYAVQRNAIFLGDIVGNGTGRGDKDPDIWGVNTDTGLFMTSAEVMAANADSVDTDGVNPSPVADSDLIDSVFFLNAQTLAITSTGVQFTFDPADPHTGSYNHILSNLTNDVDKGPGNVICGGVRYTTGIGIHASSGVTFDLDAIRAEHGDEAVVTLSVTVGTDECGVGVAANNTVDIHIIYCTEEEPIPEATYMYRFTGARQSQLHSELIPPEARFLTFATGRQDGGIGCDHGVYAEARIFPELPVALLTATPTSGGPPLAVTFNGSASTAPAGRTIVAYDWDFGDGSTGTGATANHTYAVKGRYTAKLTVTDSQGYSDEETVQIQALFQSGPVSPWISRDIGTPYTVGGARLEGSCAVVFAGGSGVTSTADQLHFLHQPITGDFTITARIQDRLFEPTATLGRAGLMVRSSLDPASPYMFVGMYDVQAGGRAILHYRSQAGAAARSSSISPFTATPPDVWLRLSRSGETFTATVSADGTTWFDPPKVQTISGAPAEMLAGLAAFGQDSGTTGNTATVTFCDLAGFPSSPPVEVCNDGTDNDADGDTDCADSECTTAPNCTGGAFRRGDANADGSLNITDGIFVLNYLFLGGETPTCVDGADANDDGALNITDGIYILNFLFLGGDDPPAPGPTDCGTDPTAEDPILDCGAYTTC